MTVTSDVVRAIEGTPLDGPVLVTGGSSGLGAAVVAAVGQARRHRRRPRPAGAAPDGGDFVQVDLADPAAAVAAVEQAVQRYGPPTAVVTAAGTDACGKLDDVPLDAWTRVVAVNLLGTAAVVRAALPAPQGEPRPGRHRRLDARASRPSRTRPPTARRSSASSGSPGRWPPRRPGRSASPCSSPAA